MEENISQTHVSIGKKIFLGLTKYVLPLLYVLFIVFYFISRIPYTSGEDPLARFGGYFFFLRIILYFCVLISLPFLISRFKKAAKSWIYLIPAASLLYFLYVYIEGLLFLNPDVDYRFGAVMAHPQMIIPLLLTVGYIVFGAIIISLPFFYFARFYKKWFGFLFLVLGLVFTYSFMPVADPNYMAGYEPVIGFQWLDHQGKFQGKFVKYNFPIPCVVDNDSDPLNGCGPAQGTPFGQAAARGLTYLGDISKDSAVLYRYEEKKGYILIYLHSISNKTDKEVSRIPVGKYEKFGTSLTLTFLDKEFAYFYSLIANSSPLWDTYCKERAANPEIEPRFQCGGKSLSKSMGTIYWKINKATGETSRVEAQPTFLINSTAGKPCYIDSDFDYSNGCQ